MKNSIKKMKAQAKDWEIITRLIKDWYLQYIKN